MTTLSSKTAHGFTLIELVIVIVLTSVLAAVAVQPLQQALSARTRVASNLDTIDSLRYATERMVRELRQTQYNAAGSGFQLTPLDAASASSNTSSGICFRRPGGNSGATLSSVALRKTGSSVTLDTAISYPSCSAAQAQTLADNVTDLRFDYWSYGSGAAPVALAVNNVSFGTLLSFIDITLTVTPSSGTAVAQRTRVVLRNGAWGAVK